MTSVTTTPAQHEAGTIRAVLPQLAPFAGILVLAAPQGLFGASTARRV